MQYAKYRNFHQISAQNQLFIDHILTIFYSFNMIEMIDDNISLSNNMYEMFK